MAVRQSPGIVLIWVYYTSPIILMGAEVTHSYVKHNGFLKRRDPIDCSASGGRRPNTPGQEGTWPELTEW
jgi:uncharacterized BrkB/YihY/UPF0761 family membrane protein